MAYEMLTGSPPFTGPSAQSVLTAHVTKAPIPVTEARTSVPPGLAALVMRCLEKKPADRYQTADELLAQLELLATPSGGIAPTSATPAVTTPVPTAPVAASQAPSRNRPLFGFAIAALAILAMVVVLPRLRRGAGSTGSGIRTIAVLPLENLGSPDDDYFVDGLTEEITNRLTGLHQLRVIARTSANQYRKSTKSPAEIGKELGADYLLEGTVRWDKTAAGSSQVRVSPALIKTTDATNVWANSYDATMAGIFKVQSDIAQEVTGALGVALAEPERQGIAETPTANPEAYDYYLRGRAAYSRGYEERDIRAAIAAWERAVTLDPQYAVAWAALSEAHSELFWFFFDRTPEGLAKAKAAADSSLRLRPDLPDGHRALGFYYYWGFLDYDHALSELNLALAKQPDNGDVIFAIAAVNRRQGRWEEAAAGFKRAADLDPRSGLNSYNLSETYLLTHQYAESEHYAERARDLSPDWAIPVLSLARLALRWHGDTAESYRVLRAAIPRVGVQGVLNGFGWKSGLTGGDVFLVARDSALSRGLAGATASVFDDSTGYFLVRAEVARLQGQAALSRFFYDSAATHTEQALKRTPDESSLHSQLGMAYAGLGRKADAIREGKRSTELLPISREAYRGSINLLQLAKIYAMVGEPDSAIALLSQLLKVPSLVSVPWLRIEPVWQPLRGNPRFEALLKSDQTN
jgi:serine/threonine-protein kinase